MWTELISQMISDLCSEMLEERRKIARLKFFSYCSTITSIQIQMYRCHPFLPHSLRDPHMMLKSCKGRTLQYQKFFFSCIMEEWSALPKHIVDSQTPVMFKNNLKAFQFESVSFCSGVIPLKK